jgi:hypothetical protein
LPIVQVGDVAYLSRHATVSSVQHDEEHLSLVKTYAMDVADRPTRFLQVKYEDVDSLGTVVFTYTLDRPDTVTVTVDFDGLNVAWDRAYLMNEQGAVNFPLYEDASGQMWPGDAVGIWQATESVIGCWHQRSGGLRFCVETEPGRRKFIGRERYNQYRWTGIFYLSWSGVDIEIDPPVPRYQYTVRIEEIDGPPH